MEEFVTIPEGVSVDIEEKKVVIRGPKGQLERDFDDPRFNHIIEMEKKDSKIIVKASEDKRLIKSLIGTMCAHMRNMMNGVTKGYSYTLKIVTTHFPITVSQAGNDIQIKNFFGEKSMRVAKLVGQTHVRIDKDSIELTGIDIESVSQTAANIELACKLRRRDRRIFQDGIYIYTKALQTGEAI